MKIIKVGVQNGTLNQQTSMEMSMRKKKRRKMWFAALCPGSPWNHEDYHKEDYLYETHILARYVLEIHEEGKCRTSRF